MRSIKNPFIAVTICAFSLMLAACGDIQQDLRLNADGSGSLETTVDIGELLGMARGFEDMGSDQDTFSDDMLPDTIITPEAPPKDAMTLLMEKVTDPVYDKEFDTTMAFISIMPDSVREKEKRFDLLEKMFVRVKSPANSGDLKFGMLLNFDNTRQLKEMVDYLQTLNESSNVMNTSSPVGMDSENFMVFEADMKAGWIRVDTMMYSGLAEQMGMTGDTGMSSEDMGMMEMMFGNSKIRSVIHVPGDVTSCTNKDAILTKDDKVIIEYPMLDVLKKGRIDGYTIYFTP